MTRRAAGARAPGRFTDDQTGVVNPTDPYPDGWANIYSADQVLPTAGVLPASELGWDLKDTTEYYGALTFVIALAPSG